MLFTPYFKHCDTLQTKAESKTVVLLGIDAAVFKHLSYLQHLCQELLSSRFLCTVCIPTAALEAAYVNLTDGSLQMGK